MFNGHMKNRIWLKEKCTWCKGSLYLEREEYGRLVPKCLSCGRTREPIMLSLYRQIRAEVMCRL